MGAWAIYGYTMVYRWTRKPVFLQFARRVADVYIRALTTGRRRGEEDRPAPQTTNLEDFDLIPK